MHEQLKQLDPSQTVYICGKMSDVEDYNRPAFNRAAYELRDAGFAVFNPAEVSGADTWRWSDYMRVSLRGMLECDALYVLDGYDTSQGANIEIRLARELGMPVYYQTPKPIPTITVTTVHAGDPMKSLMRLKGLLERPETTNEN